MPEVTAAAARFRNIASYHIQPLDDDRNRADDGAGARGFSQVLHRDGLRRVVLSRGEHTGAMLGTISGSALTVIDAGADGDRVQPLLTAYVRIDDRVAASLAQILIASFGFLADYKLAEGLRVTKAVAEWAIDPSGGFWPRIPRARAPTPAHCDEPFAVVPSFSTMTSTRRFCCRPTAESLSTTGNFEPYPLVRIRWTPTPRATS